MDGKRIIGSAANFTRPLGHWRCSQSKLSLDPLESTVASLTSTTTFSKHGHSFQVGCSQDVTRLPTPFFELLVGAPPMGLQSFHISHIKPSFDASLYCVSLLHSCRVSIAGLLFFEVCPCSKHSMVKLILSVGQYRMQPRTIITVLPLFYLNNMHNAWFEIPVSPIFRM